MHVLPIQMLNRFGPDHCDSLSLDESRRYCRRLVGGRYENFSVLSVVVPSDLRDDFAALYAFCRWADDLGDEVDGTDRSLELLQWWRDELHACFDGEAKHPVFVALRPVLDRHNLPQAPFDDLISAFEQDQRVSRYDTWDQLISYCRMSANPVGRLVLMIAGEPRDEFRFKLSDSICTGLQLTNHLQDVRRDILERDRIYLPRDFVDDTKIVDFEDRLRRSATQQYGVDQRFLDESRGLIRACVDRTWKVFEQGEPLLEHVTPRIRPMIWLLAAGGQTVLHRIEMWNYETALHRPTLGKCARLMLVARAWMMAQGVMKPRSTSRTAPGSEVAT